MEISIGEISVYKVPVGLSLQDPTLNMLIAPDVTCTPRARDKVILATCRHTLAMMWDVSTAQRRRVTRSGAARGGQDWGVCSTDS